MKTTIDEAIRIGIEAYRVFEYSEQGAIKLYRTTCQNFKEHLQKNDLPYSLEQAEQWIKLQANSSNQPKWMRKHIVAMAKALKVMKDVLHNGQVTTSLQSKLDRTPAYEKLPAWSRQLLDSYLSSISGIYAPNSLRMVKQAGSRFFFILEGYGVNSLREITAEMVRKAFIEDKHSSKAVQQEYRHYAEDCLAHFIQIGSLSKEVRCTFSEFSGQKTPLLCEMSNAVQTELSDLRNLKDTTDSFLTEYDEVCEKLRQIYKQGNYGIGAQLLSYRIIQDFRRFLMVNTLPYSHKTGLCWLAYLKTILTHNNYCNYQRIILSIGEIFSKGDLKTKVYTSRSPKYLISEWQVRILDEYLNYRKREECATSTQRSIHASCSRFLSYLNRESVRNLEEITAERIKNYGLQDKHDSVTGKNIYASQLRLFIRYLGEKGLVPKTLELAVSCQFAPNTKIVTVLSEKQISAIYRYRENASTSKELRDSAVFLLGLRMGIRISDIIRLKFSDISWAERTISFTQQKTGIFLKLPMPVDVGNSLYQYIHHGRPEQSDNVYVFVSLCAPFRRLKFGHSICKSLRYATLHCDTVPDGFHIARRTFASNLLKHGNSIPTIASALGHADCSNVDKYLSTDERQLRRCAIGLSGIEYMGGYAL